MAELTEQEIIALDKTNSDHENCLHDLAKFNGKLLEAQTALDDLIAKGYKNPDERKEMAKNDGVYFAVQCLKEDVANFEARRASISAVLDPAKANGYMTPDERREVEVAANKARTEAKKAADAALKAELEAQKQSQQTTTQQGV